MIDYIYMVNMKFLIHVNKNGKEDFIKNYMGINVDGLSQ